MKSVKGPAPSAVQQDKRSSSNPHTQGFFSKQRDNFLQPKYGERTFFGQLIQPKLEVNTPGDRYEQEADAMANKVMRSAAPEEKESLQAGPATTISRQAITAAANQSSPVPDHVGTQINASRGGGNPMDKETRSFMESRFETDFSGVRIHTGTNAVQMSRQLNAHAFTTGNDIYFNEGKYAPNTSAGKHLLAHELTHTVQQGNGNGQSIQRYHEEIQGSDTFRVADDVSVAVVYGYPNHELYALPGKAATANTALKNVGSGITLTEESTQKTFKKGSSTQALKKVIPTNTQNKTKGDKMDLWADCGKSCGVVVGGTNRVALYNNPSTGAKAETAPVSPARMKAEIMEQWLNHKKADPATKPAEKTKIDSIIAQAQTLKTQMDQLLKDYSKATASADKTRIASAYSATGDKLGEKVMEFYNSLTTSEQLAIDKLLKINTFANPSVGQGYTISSGGAPYPGKSTWNFHWGGVVMESNDKKDKVTLENYAVGDPSVQNKDWDIAMYGILKEDQTFHYQHKDSQLHGQSPTTMAIKNK